MRKNPPDPLEWIFVWIILTTGCTHSKSTLRFVLYIVFNISQSVQEVFNVISVASFPSTINNKLKAWGETYRKCSYDLMLSCKGPGLVAISIQDHYCNIVLLIMRLKPLLWCNAFVPAVKNFTCDSPILLSFFISDRYQ